jgi:hypothetical protein
MSEVPIAEKTKYFKKKLKACLKKYSKSVERITREINSINPQEGDTIPGLGLGIEVRVKKLRLELSEYKIGKSKGLRFIFMFVGVKNQIIPLTIYKKGTYKKENEKLKEIKLSLKEILKEISL